MNGQVHVWATWPAGHDEVGRPDGYGWLEVHTCAQETHDRGETGFALDDPDLVAELIRQGPDALMAAVRR